MKENYMFIEDKLKGEYYDVFKKVEVYAVAQEYEFSQVEEVMMDLLDLLLAAQDEEKPVREIVGSDIEVFCENLFIELKKGSVKSFFEGCYRFAWMILFIEFIDFMLRGVGVSLQDKTNVLGYLMGSIGVFIFSGILYVVIKPILFRWKKLRIGVYILISFIGGLATAMFIAYLFQDYELWLPYWVVFVTPAFYILLYKCVQLVHRYQTEGSIWKKKDLEEKPFGEIMKSQLKEEFPQELYKRYQKMNKKREKRGKKSLTPEEFTEKIRKEIKDGKIAMIVALIVLSVFLLTLCVHSFIVDGFVNTLIFVVILAIAEIPAAFIFWSSGFGEREKKKYLEECERLSMTLPEYLEYLQAKNQDEKQKGIEK